MSVFYKDRVCLNVLAKDVENATEIYNAADGHVLIGVLSKQFATVETAVDGMKKFADQIDNAVSVGLGAGDPNQWKFVGDIAREYKPKHINQVFTGVGYTRAAVNNDETMINCLVSPSGKPGYVTISTGPLSSKEEKAVIPIHTAIAMMKDMGANAVKFFPMNGLATIEEYRKVAEACAKEAFYLEPTGGIDLENVEEIVEIALKAGVEKIIPHVYSSIINKETGKTNVSDVKILYNKLTVLVNKYQS
ncbi:2-dehydro-3-deoxy-phosphogluconate aldolase [Ferdinandcohnia quinoae]|uniref:KDGP aldolase family protein n=1 Tax=Fredinandcohnia quinoae TaxID=2918902 RepID=A0AAW5E4A0_9BACI|nr:KDGP aldolase family protein [Fredinandcohnia sp. SECRCQ15]MCH1627766.1 KDGP aldolase family protein [Fredinandcohnia sp. SECRCQ15]